MQWDTVKSEFLKTLIKNLFKLKEDTNEFAVAGYSGYLKTNKEEMIQKIAVGNIMFMG